MIKYVTDILNELNNIKEYHSYWMGTVIKNERRIKKIFELKNQLAGEVYDLSEDCDYEELEDVCSDCEFGTKFMLGFLQNVEYFEEFMDGIESLIDNISDDEEDYVYAFEYQGAMDIKDDLETILYKLEFNNVVDYQDVEFIFDKVDKLLEKH